MYCITKPTRVTNQSNTINHFIANITNQEIKPGLFPIDITDHYPVFCVTTCDSIPSSKSKQNYYNRDYKKTDLAVFKKEISTVVTCAHKTKTKNV